MLVRYLLAFEDQTWDTDTFDVPIEKYDREKLVQWAEQNLLSRNDRREAVCFQVYECAAAAIPTSSQREDDPAVVAETPKPQPKIQCNCGGNVVLHCDRPRRYRCDLCRTYWTFSHEMPDPPVNEEAKAPRAPEPETQLPPRLRQAIRIWLKANDLMPSQVRCGVFPLGMVQNLLERVEAAEQSCQNQFRQLEGLLAALQEIAAHQGDDHVLPTLTQCYDYVRMLARDAIVKYLKLSPEEAASRFPAKDTLSRERRVTVAGAALRESWQAKVSPAWSFESWVRYVAATTDHPMHETAMFYVRSWAPPIVDADQKRGSRGQGDM